MRVTPKRRTAWISGLVALCFLHLSVTAASAEQCYQDEDFYTLFFYSPSDAMILQEQRCEASAMELQSNRSVEISECRCYSQSYDQVLSSLNRGQSPAQVKTKRITGTQSPSGSMSCRSALEQCEKACQDPSKNAPECPLHAGVIAR